MKESNSITKQLNHQADQIRSLQVQLDSPLIDFDHSVAIAKTNWATLDRAVKDGKLKSVKIGHALYFRQCDLKSYINKTRSC